MRVALVREDLEGLFAVAFLNERLYKLVVASGGSGRTKGDEIRV